VNTVSLYAEAEEEQLSVFVRDRGAGFDLSHVDGDRHGVRGSIDWPHAASRWRGTGAVESGRGHRGGAHHAPHSARVGRIGFECRIDHKD
jgi:hypothetical protein